MIMIYIDHLLETSLEYFGPNNLRKVIDNLFIINFKKT